MKKHILIGLYLALLTTFLVCPVSFAATQSITEGGGSSPAAVDTIPNESGTDYENKLNEITGNVKKIAIVFISLAAVATGILYMTASMNPDNKTWAKAAFTGLILGTFMLALSGDIGKLVMGALDVKRSDLKVVQGKHGDLTKKAKAAKWMDESRPETESNILVTTDPSGEKVLCTFIGEKGAYLYPEKSELHMVDIVVTGKDSKGNEIYDWKKTGEIIKINKEDVPDDAKSEPVWVATIGGKNYYLSNLSVERWVPENGDLDWGGEWLLRLAAGEVDKYIQVIDGKKYSGGIQLDNNGKVQISGKYNGEINVGEKAFYFSRDDVQNAFFQQGPGKFPLGPYPVDLVTIKKDGKDVNVWYLQVKLPDGQIFPIKCYLIPDPYEPYRGEWMTKDDYRLDGFGYSIP